MMKPGMRSTRFFLPKLLAQSFYIIYTLIMVMTTYQEVVLESPAKAGVSVAEAVPAAKQTVRADSLLTETERKVAAKRGIIFGIEHDGITYLVPAHRQVPVGSTVPRTSRGSLIGVAAVTGG